MTYNEYIRQIAKLKAAGENRIIAVIPDVENFAYKALLDFIDSTLEVKNGSLVASKETIAILNQFDAGYLKVLGQMKLFNGAVSKFLKQLPAITDVIKDYQVNTNNIKWSEADVSASQKMVVNEIINAYSENGLNTNFVQPLRNLLYQNIAAGTNLKQAKETLRDYVKGTPDKDSKLSRYITQTAQQAVDGYAGMINKKLMATFTYPFVIMSGSLISTSAPQCMYGINKLDGVISREDFEKEIKPVAEDNGLIPGTEFDNLDFNKFHYGCRHDFTPAMINPNQKN